MFNICGLYYLKKKGKGHAEMAVSRHQRPAIPSSLSDNFGTDHVKLKLNLYIFLFDSSPFYDL